MRLYRLLLRLLPRDFRQRHGASMEETFRAARADAARAGMYALVQLYAREAADLLRTGGRLRRQQSISTAGAMTQLRPNRPRRGAALLDDVVLATRSFTRHAAFFAFAALTLGFGIGATTAIYSALKSVVLEPPRYPGGERVVKLWRTMGSGLRIPLTREQIAAAETETVVFDAVATHSAGLVTVTGLGDPARFEVQHGNAGLASFMGMQPVLGRIFVEEEEVAGDAHVVLVSHALWRSRFGGRADVLGQTLTVNGEPWTIIGVLPADAVRPDGMPQPVDLWIPLGERMPGRQLIARLREGVTIEAATERMRALLGSSGEFGVEIMPATAMRSGALREPLRVLMIAVALLLLIACVNVANLLLHRSAARTRETAVRAALGATRMRLLRHFLTESLLLALCGGAVGVAVAWAGTSAAAALRPADLVAMQAVRMDGGVLVFSLLVSLAAWLIFSLPPALRGAQPQALGTLTRAARSGVTGSARLRWTLVGFEVALSFALLVGAATLIANVRDSAARNSGYEPGAFVALDVRLPEWRYVNDAVRRDAFDRLIERIRRVPGVDQVALAGGVPPRWGITFGRVEVEGATADTESTVFHGGVIDDGYLRAIGQPLVAGRTFLPHEVRADVPVVVLGETAARRIFDGADAVGRRFRLNGDEFTVIGVARDITIVGLTEADSRPIAYWPITEVWNQMQVVVRTTRRDSQLFAELRRTVRSLEAEALVEVKSGAALLGASLARERFTAAVLTTFAALALLLSAIGLYGVLSQIVTGRTHEIGLRVALGADQTRIRALIMSSGARVVAAGLIAGALLVNGGLRLLGSRVFGIEQRGVAIYLIAAFALGATSLVAMWRPAARAARIDPMQAMATE